MSDNTAGSFIGSTFRRVFSSSPDGTFTPGGCTSCGERALVIHKDANHFCLDCASLMATRPYLDQLTFNKKWSHKAPSSARIGGATAMFYFLYGDEDNPCGFLSTRFNLNICDRGDLDWIVPGWDYPDDAPTHLLIDPIGAEKSPLGPQQMFAPLLNRVMSFTSEQGIDKFIVGVFNEQSANYQYGWSSPDHLFLSGDAIPFVGISPKKLNNMPFPYSVKARDCKFRTVRPHLVRELTERLDGLSKSELDILLFSQSRLAAPRSKDENALLDQHMAFIRENRKDAFRYLTNPQNRNKIPHIGSGEHFLIRHNLREDE